MLKEFEIRFSGFLLTIEEFEYLASLLELLYLNRKNTVMIKIKERYQNFLRFLLFDTKDNIVYTKKSYIRVSLVYDSEFQDFFDKLCRYSITSQEKSIIQRRFGLLDGLPLTYKQLSAIFSLSDERIRNIVNSCKRKLIHPNNLQHVSYMLDKEK